jgi:anti-anti-sigma factor
MAVTALKSEDSGIATLRVDGRFDFNVHRQFRDAYHNLPENSDGVVVDLKGAEYMDSSALGMLLLLREHFGGQAAKVTIVNTSPEIRKILEIANFDRLFAIQ